MSHPSMFLRWLLPALAVSTGILGISAAWLAVAILSNAPVSWMALLAAADMALMLHLTRAPAGIARVLVALLGTCIAIIASQWLIVATHMGFVIGLEPLESAQRLGPVLAWELTKLNLSHSDWLLLLIALPLAAWLVRSKRP